MNWPRPTWPHLRDGMSYLLGVAGVVHEVLLVKPLRIEVLMFFGGLIGLPIVTKQDDKRPPGPPPTPPASGPSA